MFTSGQWVVAILFFIVFVVVMIYSYTKDKALHKKYYKGAAWVLVGFITFILLLFLIKVFIKG
tara:strand:- start:16042 stop:16230 length:189 start_codon:yes stop_codon:yes gene_type:complete